jgi:hypothetical protein
MKQTNTISNERQTRQWKKLVEKSNVERPTTNDNTKARKLLMYSIQGLEIVLCVP